MEWQIIVALVVGIPIILFPAAFVWYLNTTGLYRVIRDARQRQRRAAAVREAERIVRGRVAAGMAPETEEQPVEAV